MSVKLEQENVRGRGGAGAGEGGRAGAGDVEEQGTGPTHPEKGLYLKGWCVEQEMMMQF